jgi:UDP-N-acetylglucosamine 4,6-dehydratase
MRPGEKLHEEMISADDTRRTIELENRFVVLPVVAEWGFVPPKGPLLKSESAYSSDTNKQWISADEMAVFIKDVME